MRAQVDVAGPAQLAVADPPEVGVDGGHEVSEGWVLHAAVRLAIPAAWGGEGQRGNGEWGWKRKGQSQSGQAQVPCSQAPSSQAPNLLLELVGLGGQEMEVSDGRAGREGAGVGCMEGLAPLPCSLHSPELRWVAERGDEGAERVQAVAAEDALAALEQVEDVGAAVLGAERHRAVVAANHAVVGAGGAAADAAWLQVGADLQHREASVE
jgi:hypothetical protein